ncbi:hypothetical protein [Paenibacillus sp. FSL E2-0151]|uniref:hypothetical protein n=1 Tax=Paenibacillus sp. FSL E2-0151 TaxID=2921357 RepID=UPI0030EE8CF7
MEELLENLSKIVGIPSIVFAIILMIIRIRPITLFTSNPVEVKMLSKEKRFSVRIVKYLFEVFIILIIMLSITVSVFKEKSMFNPIIAIIWGISLIAFLMFVVSVLEVKNKKMTDLVRPMPKVWSVVVFLIVLIFSVGFYLLPSYYIGAQFSLVLNDTEKLTISEIFFIMSLISAIYLIIIVCFLMPIGRLLYRFFDFDNALPNSNNKYVYFEIEEDGEIERWYLNYPIDSKQYYLTDSCRFSPETHSRFIEIEELYKKTLKIHVETT